MSKSWILLIVAVVVAAAYFMLRPPSESDETPKEVACQEEATRSVNTGAITEDQVEAYIADCLKK